MKAAERSGKPISLYPDDLHRVAVRFAHGQDRLDGIADTLNSALQNAGGMAGNDDYGHKFGKKYDPAADALFRTLAAACRAIGQHAIGLVTTANNYIKADHHSDAKASKGGPHTYPRPMVFADVVYPTPATAIGPGHTSVPDVIAKYWPNGHQDTLRAAADAYRKASGDIDDLGHHLHQQVVSITDTNSDESVDAMADFWNSIWRGGHGADKAPLSAAKEACDQLAKACDGFAQAIDDARGETEHRLAGAGIAIGVTTAVGIALTPFTFGASDAGAAALDGAEAAAILGSVEVTLDESVATIGSDMIADAETYLQAAADGVPEVEAVDAETTEVGQALERELAETEAREPAGVGGGRGGAGRGGNGERAGSDELPDEQPGEGEAPTTYEGKSAAVRDILTDADGELIGEEDSAGVRMVSDAELEKIHADLYKRLGKPSVKPTPKGDIEVWELSTDPKSTVTYRPFSKSGGPTIDMNNVEKLNAKRLHIPQN